MIDTIFLQTDYDLFTIGSFVTIIILVIITGVSVYLTNNKTRTSNELTRESNRLLETELKSRLRPLLEITESSGRLLVYSPETMKVLVRGILKNSGRVPIRKTWMYLRESNNYKIEHLIKEKKEIRSSGTEIGTIQPGGTKEIEKKISWASEKKMGHLVVWLEYQFMSEKETTVLVLDVVAGQSNLKQWWYLQEDIDEAEKDFENMKAGKGGGL